MDRLFLLKMGFVGRQGLPAEGLKMSFLRAFLAGVLVLVLPALALGEARVLGVRNWSSTTCTRLVVDLSEEVAFKEISSAVERDLVVEFKAALARTEPAQRIQDSLVAGVSLSSTREGTVRLKVNKKDSGFRHTVFLLPKVDGRPVRLVVDIENPAAGRRLQEQRRAVQTEKGGKAKVVVIDAGHGGEDPGAVGCRGTYEKHVVLAIAKALQERLNRSSGIKAFLTRTGDYFLGLRQRVEMAKEYGADLFISIHADSSPNRSTKGASAYCLSLTGATDEAAKILAEKENSSDLIGGVKLSADHDLNTILVDMVQTQTINESMKLGGMVLGSLQPVQEIKFSSPRQAGFRVLKAPDVPSVLVEVGFLSNPEEEARLKDPSFQARLAQALSEAVGRFLGRDPAQPILAKDGARDLSNSVSAKSGKVSASKKEHVVQPGQTLSAIATMYNTSVRELKSLNQIQEPSLIRPGQRIAIP
jgi:N-acetylmuramoyl-L-alanine amidase